MVMSYEVVMVIVAFQGPEPWKASAEALEELTGVGVSLTGGA